jgi:hypothetical protein
LLLSLTLTGDEHLACARLVLLAGVRSVTRRLIRVATSLLLLSARLLTRLTIGILALARAMAGLSAEMIPTSKFLSANLAATNINQPALLILDHALPTHASTFHQKWTFRTALAVEMASMWYLRMTAPFRTATRLSTWWRASPTRQWRHQYRLATIAGNLLEDGFFARTAGPFVAKVIAIVSPTFQEPTTLTGADVLGLEAIVHRPRS